MLHQLHYLLKTNFTLQTEFFSFLIFSTGEHLNCLSWTFDIIATRTSLPGKTRIRRPLPNWVPRKQYSDSARQFLLCSGTTGLPPATTASASRTRSDRCPVRQPHTVLIIKHSCNHRQQPAHAKRPDMLFLVISF
jgi:hypothetical protein